MYELVVELSLKIIHLSTHQKLKDRQFTPDGNGEKRLENGSEYLSSFSRLLDEIKISDEKFSEVKEDLNKSKKQKSKKDKQKETKKESGKGKGKDKDKEKKKKLTFRSKIEDYLTSILAHKKKMKNL